MARAPASPIARGSQRLLVASHQSGPGHELQGLVERRGYSVVRAFTASEALDHARRAPPDLIIVDERLPDRDGLDLTRALRDDQAIGGSTPILLATRDQTPPGPARHNAALRAGVWEFLSQPFNADDVAARLQVYLAHKHEADRARAEEPLKDVTGLFTARGLALRARELSVQAFHHDAPLACLALAPLAPLAPIAPGVPQHDLTAALALLAAVLKASGRRSDAIGRLAPGEFAVVAPGTDAAGAVLLAHRLARAMQAAAPRATTPLHSSSTPAASGAAALRVGYDAVSNARSSPVDPTNLLARATNALRSAKAAPGGEWIRRYGER